MIRITPTELKSTGIGTYDYSTSISGAIASFDDKRTRFFNCVSALLNKYFEDVKNQDQEYDAKLVSFLLNNHQRFLEDLVDDSGILDNMAEVVKNIASSHSSSGTSTFSGLSAVQKDRIVVNLKKVCQKAVDKISSSSSTRGGQYAYKRMANTLKADLQKKFDMLYAGLPISAKKSDIRLSSKKGDFIALSKNFINNDPKQTTTLYYKYKVNRGKTKSLMAQLFSISVMEKNEIDTMQRISNYTENGLKRLDNIVKKAGKKDFIKGAKNVAKILFFPFKMLTSRFWKNVYEFVKKGYVDLVKGVTKFIVKDLLFPLEAAIFKNLKSLFNSKVAKFLKWAVASVYKLAKQLSDKVRMTAFKLVKGLLKILRLPWFFIALGTIFGKLLQDIFNKILPDDSIFKTKEFTDLPLMGNETTLEMLSKNKYLQPISSEIMFVDNILHGINDFIGTFDKKDDKKNVFSDILGYDERNDESKSRVRDYTFDILNATNILIHKIFIGSPGKKSFLSSVIETFVGHIFVPIQQKFGDLDAIYNGLDFEKLTEMSKSITEQGISSFIDFLNSFIPNLGMKAGMKAGLGIAQLIPGGPMVKIVSMLLGGITGRSLFASVLGNAFEENKTAFDVAYDSTDKLNKMMERDEVMYSTMKSIRGHRSLISKALENGKNEGFMYRERSSDNAQKKALKSTLRTLAGKIQTSSENIGTFYRGEQGESKEKMRSLLKNVKGQLDEEYEDINETYKRIRKYINDTEKNAFYPRDIEKAKKLEQNWISETFKNSSQSKISKDIDEERKILGDEKLNIGAEGMAGINGPFASRMARLQYLNYLLRAYEANKITTQDFIKEFNESSDFKNTFYERNWPRYAVGKGEAMKITDKNAEMFLLGSSSELRSMLGEAIKNSSYGIAGQKLDTAVDIESDGTIKTESDGLFVDKFNKVFDPISDQFIRNAEQTLKSFPEGEEKDKLMELLKQLKGDPEFRNKLKYFLYSQTKDFEYETLIGGLAREPNLPNEIEKLVKNPSPLFASYMDLGTFLVLNTILEKSSSKFIPEIVSSMNNMGAGLNESVDLVRGGWGKAVETIKGAWTQAIEDEKKDEELSQERLEASQKLMSSVVAEKAVTDQTVASLDVLLTQMKQKLEKYRGKTYSDIESQQDHPEGDAGSLNQ